MDWRKIKLIVYDFDGVMTDNRVLLSENGIESVFLNRSDGLAISKIKQLNIEQIIISTEKNPIVQKRAEKLKIKCFNSVESKMLKLKSFLVENNYDVRNVVFVGNDINDLEVMRFVSQSIACADAHSEILSIADFITEAKGGFGVIREIYDYLIKVHKR